MPSPTENEPSANLPSGFRQSVAVVIGINDYSNGIAHLQSAVNDATRLATLLAEQQGYHVQLLVENVTRQRLATLFTQELPKSLDADDRLLVYFAGHGVADNGDDGPAGYVLPQDAKPDDPTTFVAMTELNQWLNALACRHLLLILDCCFAGAFRWATTRNLVLISGPLYRQRYDRFIQDPAWEVLTSAAANETASDLLSRLGTRPDDGDHSPFALALYDALAGKADFLVARSQGAPQGDGVITAPELYLYIRDQLDPADANAPMRQTPGLWPLRRHGKGEYIFLVPGRQPDLPDAPPLTQANNPYRGLEPYDEQHSALFFGRDELAKELQAVVTKSALTVVTGVSGSGKSSLVKAGLIPKVRLDPLHSWQILDPVRPGAKPLQALAALFGEAAGSFDLPTQVQAWLTAHPGTELLLVIDQFEELVTLSSEADRSAVIQQLATLLAQANPALHIVLTVRSDFEPQFANGPLKAAWGAGRFVVTAMTQDELREVIVQPASARVLYFEPDTLVDRIINEVVQMPGALPLLSFTMSELYLRYLARHAAGNEIGDRSMTEADYDALGGVAGALRTRADAEYEALTPPDRSTMQKLLLRMVALQGAELARRRVSRGELDYAAAGENERVNQIIQRLVDARLLVTGQDETGDAYVEPAHDTLIQGWDKLWNWVRAEQENLVLQRRLTPAAFDWQRGGRATGLLWDDDPRLRQADAVRLSPQSWLNRVESDFVAASIHQRQRNQQRLIGSLVGAMLIFALLAIFAFIQRNNARDQEAIAVNQSNARATQEAIAVAQRNEAERQAAISRSRELASVAQGQVADDPESAILIAQQANMITRTFESENILRQAISQSPIRAELGGGDQRVFAADMTNNRLLLAGQQGDKAFVQLLDVETRQPLAEFDIQEASYVSDAGFSPDGARIMAVGDDGFVRVWEAESGNLLLRAPGFSAIWSPDSTAIATAGENLAADVWDVASGQLRITVGEREEGQYEKLHFSPNGQQLVTTYNYPNAEAGSPEFTAKVWDLQSGELVTQFAINRDVAFSPDGLLLAYGSGGTAMLRNAATYAELDPVPLDLQNVFYQQFSPSGSYLVTASSDQTVRLWTIGAEISRVLLVRVAAGADLNTSAEFAEFSPDERLLVTVDGPQMQVWDIRSGALLATLRHGDTRVNRLRFTPDGRYFASVGDDGSVRLWGGRLGEEWANLPATLAHFSPDSRTVAAATENGVQLWDVASRLPLTVSVQQGTTVQDLFFSSNGAHLYTVHGPDVTWWNRNNGEPVGALQVVSGTIMKVALTTDEQSLATLAYAEREGADLFDPHRNLFLINLWKSASQSPAAPLQTMPDFIRVDDFAFSPDGALLLVTGATEQSEAGSNRLLRVWEVATGALRYGLDFPRATLARFSPDDKTLVTVSRDEIGLWNAADGSNLAHIPAGNTLFDTGEMSFNADGSRLALLDSSRRSVLVWDLPARQLLLTLSGQRNPISELQLSPDASLILTVSPADPSVRLWNGKSGDLKTSLPLGSYPTELSPDDRYLLLTQNGVAGVHLVRFDELMALAGTRIIRSLTCEEERDFLHQALTCDVATPRVVRD